VCTEIVEKQSQHAAWKSCLHVWRTITWPHHVQNVETHCGGSEKESPKERLTVLETLRKTLEKKLENVREEQDSVCRELRGLGPNPIQESCMRVKESYILNEKGEKVAVVLDIAEYQNLLSSTKQSSGATTGQRKSLRGITNGSTVTEEDFADVKQIWR